ncbi:outer membrane protein OmpW [Marinobacter lipolyticus SM19]|uniref:Outer membrane protein OmpW n=1 Tax=Marinobacter lipolyticus SM19 TaxID=1318628 RepID=R8B036_9GAMM|nr:OmpW family outer membrane protein [Marinobacter lipolyticus]EON91951.1 outer membrane protein OmpW [Marinobacter lipolyticus SM19]
MSRIYQFGVVAVGLLAAAPATQAYEAGDFMLRAGAAHVAPDDSSSDLNLEGVGTLPNARVSVDSNTQLGITATYMVTSHIGIGVLGATPFKHNIEGAGALNGIGKLAETKHLPPTLTLQYFPLDSGSMIQPYAGIGVNYTHFFEEKTTTTLTSAVDGVAQSVLGTAPGTINGTELELDESVGVALELGVDWMLDEHFGLNAALWWADISTDATITALADGAEAGKITTEVDIDPMVYMVGFTYKF